MEWMKRPKSRSSYHVCQEIIIECWVSLSTQLSTYYFIDTIKYREDLLRYLLASSNEGKIIQNNINMIGKDDRFNDVRMRDMLNPVYKNVMRKQNPIEIVFKDISKFDTQNPITFTLLSKI